MNNAEVLVKFKGDTKDLDKQTNKASSLIKGLAKGFGGVLATGAGIATTAILGATKAIGSLTKASVEAYAEYEQLIGGVETLFKESADKVENYANMAYKTAGLSANEYMSTITSFSASLLQSLGGDTDKAADYADRAIRDMSDNANKMGTDMSLIQSAYQGFAKQNYTMLDNLKLGYGGTKTEMERLISDASQMTKEMEELGISVDATDMSFGNMVNAISVVQKHLGITGTTALEAEKTITGSLNMTKSAWNNFVAGLSKQDVNIDGLIDQVIDSAMKFVDNVIPVIERAINGIAKALPIIATKIGDELPVLIDALLPKLVDALVNLVQSLVKNLPSIIKTLMEAVVKITMEATKLLPDIIDAILASTIAILDALIDALPELLPVLLDAIIKGIVKITEYLPEIIRASIDLLMGIIKALPTIITALVENLPMIIETIITCLLESIPELIEGAIKLFFGILEALPTIIAELIKAIPQIYITIVKVLTSSESISKMLEAGKNILHTIVNGIVSVFSSIYDAGKNLILGLWNGIGDKVNWIINKIKGFGNSVMKAIKGIFGIHSPSTEFEFIGRMNMLGLEQGMEEMKPELQRTIDSVFDLQPNISGSMSNTLSPNLNVVVNNNMEVDPLGQVVNQIKTFSGGAKNDYNWGATK